MLLADIAIGLPFVPMGGITAAWQGAKKRSTCTGIPPQ
jgi:hypothetical protein